MGLSENNRAVLPVRSPELKLEMARLVGFIARKRGRRTHILGLAGGAREIRTHDTDRAPTSGRHELLALVKE